MDALGLGNSEPAMDDDDDLDSYLDADLGDFDDDEDDDEE